MEHRICPSKRSDSVITMWLVMAPRVNEFSFIRRQMDLLRSVSCVNGASKPASLQRSSKSPSVAPTPTSKVSLVVRVWLT